MKTLVRKRQIRAKENTKNPSYSLYLDIYYRKGKRKSELLGISLYRDIEIMKLFDHSLNFDLLDLRCKSLRFKRRLNSKYNPTNP